MNHEKIVNAVKAQREIASNAFVEITRLKDEAFERMRQEEQALKEQLKGLKVSKKEVLGA